METATGPAPAASPMAVFEAVMAFHKTAALKAAVELDLFRAVGEGSADAARLGQRTGAAERGVRILCDYLVVNGILQKNGNEYSHTPTSAAFLDPRSPACVGSITKFMADPMMIQNFMNLAEAVRRGGTAMPGDGTVDPENPIWVEFAHSMAPMMGPLAGPLAQIALEGRSGPKEVLDIAAGHGLFGIEVAKADPQARITAIDWRAVLDVARANAEKAGVADRYKVLPGSAFDVEYGGPYDIVLITNFVHHFDVETNVALLKKIHAALKPGGRAATLEFVPNEDRVSPPMPASFSLVMLAGTRAGDAYTFSELKSMYEAAGYTDVQCRPVPMSPHTVVVGTK